MGRLEGEHCGRGVPPNSAANGRVVLWWRWVGSVPSLELSSPLCQRSSERFVSAAVAPTVAGSGSVANLPTARNEKEKEDRRPVHQRLLHRRSAHHRRV